MKNYILYLLTATLLIAIASCSKNDTVKSQGEKVSISINFGTLTRGGAFETDINRVRVIMFRVSDGKFMLNEYFDPITAGKVTFDSFTGNYDMYYIVNEPLVGGNPTAAYSGIYLKSQIEALKLPYATPVVTPYEPAEIAMFKWVSNQAIGTTNALSVSVDRTMAKVLVDMVVDRSLISGGDYVEITSVTIKDLPEYCNMFPARYNGGTYTSSEIQSVVPTSVGDVDTYNHEFYVPEYLVASGSTQNAVIEIKGKTKLTGLDCKWTQPLGDKMSIIQPYPRYDIRRNYVYQFIGRVKGYGDHDMFIITKIVDWVETDISEELN